MRIKSFVTSLLSEYDHIVTTILHGKDKITFDEVCAALYNNEIWKKDQKEHKSTSAAKYEDDESEFVLISTLSKSQYDEWIMDSGCTYHMCSNKEWFFNFEELNEGVVNIGTNDALQSTGIGSIHLKCHDGSTKVLTDVRYVPHLKKNHIFLGVLGSKGFTVTMRDGILKVVSSTLVVMKGIRKNNLHYF
ncbi:uncharacterized protein LOC112092567 [Morus notabilis]|uniref:uncharacterized protein LOC112092567 n=1 Tax=Morus notabilis TaxID=981085 RepID=UPI000CECF871|nr:uncharacterized protein LOC112092567 [Morus notabilis]